MSYLTPTAQILLDKFVRIAGFSVDADTYSDEEGTKFELYEEDMIKLVALLMELDELRYETAPEGNEREGETPLHEMFEAQLRARLG